MAEESVVDSIAAASESPQPLPLTANSSRCTSPLSSPSDRNASSADDHDEESGIAPATLNLSKPTPSHSFNLSSNKSDNKSATSLSVSNNIISSNNSHSDSNGGSLRSKQYKSKSDSSPRVKSKASFATDYATIPTPHSPDFVQLLLEYRQVLLDVLSNTILLADNEPGEAGNRCAILPLKCACGLTSRLSNQITRSSTYVHQLELRFRSLTETPRATETKYTPKRPWFISSTPLNAPLPFPMSTSSKSSLLDKKLLLSRQQQQQLQQPQPNLGGRRPCGGVQAAPTSRPKSA